MTLQETLLAGGRLLVCCNARGCRLETPLDAAFFAARLDPSARVADLQKRLVCAACGTRNLTVRAEPPRENSR